MLVSCSGLVSAFMRDLHQKERQAIEIRERELEALVKARGQRSKREREARLIQRDHLRNVLAESAAVQEEPEAKRRRINV